MTTEGCALSGRAHASASKMRTALAWQALWSDGIRADLCLSTKAEPPESFPFGRERPVKTRLFSRNEVVELGARSCIADRRVFGETPALPGTDCLRKMDSGLVRLAAVLQVNGGTEDRPGVAPGVCGGEVGSAVSVAGSTPCEPGLCDGAARAWRRRGGAGDRAECFHCARAQGVVAARGGGAGGMVAQDRVA